MIFALLRKWSHQNLHIFNLSFLRAGNNSLSKKKKTPFNLVRDEPLRSNSKIKLIKNTEKQHHDLQRKEMTNST